MYKLDETADAKKNYILRKLLMTIKHRPLSHSNSHTIKQIIAMREKIIIRLLKKSKNA